MQYKNFSAVKNYKDFLMGGHILLIQTLGNFFSATVRLHFEPLREIMPAYNIDIMACINRSVYILDVDRVLLISHLNVDESCKALEMEAAANVNIFFPSNSPIPWPFITTPSKYEDSSTFK